MVGRVGRGNHQQQRIRQIATCSLFSIMHDSVRNTRQGFLNLLLHRAFYEVNGDKVVSTKL